MAENKAAEWARHATLTGLALVMASLPFDFPIHHTGLGVPMVQSFLCTEIIIVLFIAEIAFLLDKSLRIRLPRFALPLFLFFMLHIALSLFRSEKIVWSIKYTARFFLTATIPFLVITFVRARRELYLLLGALFLGGVLAAPFVFIQYAWPLPLEPLQRFFQETAVAPTKVRGLFGWPTTMSAFYLMVISAAAVIAVYPFDTKRPRAWRIASIAVIALSAACMVLSGARGWIVGLWLSFAILWCAARAVRREYANIIIAACAIVLFAGILFFFGYEKMIEQDLTSGEAARMSFFTTAFKTWNQTSMKGVGPDMFCWIEPNHFRTHNIFLEQLTNLGLAGLLIFCWLLFALYDGLLRRMRKSRALSVAPIACASFAAITSALAHSQVDYFWNQPQMSALFWSFVAIGIADSMLEEQPCQGTRAPVSIFGEPSGHQ